MKQEYIEKIYAGWLAKIIGIRLGAAIEGWTYEKIKNIYGDLRSYPVDYSTFAADDDSNGPIFFIRALEDKAADAELTAQDVAEALLNYAPFEHGFFWWGGYGVSTEHTAYLNLRNGIPAPRSGSIEQNGSTMAEQIGGQIFIDSWGLVAPGNPDLAAKFAREAASVTHGGNGIYGGIFVAVSISFAFVEQDIRKIIEKGLSYIPCDSEYARVVRAVMDYHEQNPDNWRACYKYIFENFGYDKYPGNCHIIPNIAVMILSLLYGGGNFDDTINICNMCGWDTDCNVGNVATIMGVRNGLEGIDYDKWRKPINDFLACSSVIGSLNMMDIPYGALYMARLAYICAGEEMPEPWKTIADNRIDSCHFEYPGSTHAMRVRVECFDARENNKKEYMILNTSETAATGERALKFAVKSVKQGENIYVYKKTYYYPQDFDDSRYDPSFSPVVYPGQILHGSAYLPEYSEKASVSLYVHDARTDKIYESEHVKLEKEKWQDLNFRIPAMEGALLDEMGFVFHVESLDAYQLDFAGLVDDLYADGEPEYVLDFAKEREEAWNVLHREVSQFTKLKGHFYLEQGEVHLSCSDFAEAYTGRHDWKDYTAEFSFVPLTGDTHRVNVCVQGAIRSYAFALLPNDRAGLLKNQNGYVTLCDIPFMWEKGKEYVVKVTVQGNKIMADIDGCHMEAVDHDQPYSTGSIGLSVEQGSHCKYKTIRIGKVSV